jgi:hypothetical protein
MGELDPEQRIRAVMEKVIDRIASDPAFRQKLIEDSEVALSAAGMDKEVEELRALTPEGSEVGAFLGTKATERHCVDYPKNTAYYCHDPSCAKTVVSAQYALA